MNKEKEIGEIFKEGLDGYRKEPPANLWNDIQNDPTLLKYNRRRKMARTAKWAVVATVAAVAIAVVALLPSIPKEQEKTTPLPVQNPSSTIVASENENVSNTVPAQISTPEQPSETTDRVAHSNQPSPVTFKQEPRINHQEMNTAAAVESIQETKIESPSLAQSLHAVTHPETAPMTSETKPSKPSTPIVSAPVFQLKTREGKPIEFSHDTSVCRGSRLTLFVKNAMDVRWNIGLTGESITVFPDAPMFVEATVTTFDKVDTTIYIHVGIFECGLWIPTAFTPNGDGLNDEFIIHAPADITNYECTIFDRGRGMLFRTNNIKQGWDGNFNGNPLPFGAYFYIITYRDALGEKHVEKGQITLVR